MSYSGRSCWRRSIVGAAITAGAILIGSAFAEQFRAGDTVELTARFLDADGISAVPTSARAFIVLNGSPIDSTPTLANAQITRYHRLLKWRYRIPAAAPDSASYAFWVRASNATITDDYFPCEPATATIRGSTSPAGFWAAVADTTTGVIDSTLGGGAYDLLGNPISDARVYVTREENLWNLMSMMYSAAGDYSIPVPISATEADTFYVSIYRQGSWSSSYVRVVFP